MIAGTSLDAGTEKSDTSTREEGKRPRTAEGRTPPLVCHHSGEAWSTGELRGLTVVAGCYDYMDNRLEEVKRQEVRATSAFGPLLAISRVRHHLEGMAFAFSENRTEGTFHDPAHVETLSLGRLRFLAPMIDGKEVSRRTGQEEDISRLSSPTSDPGASQSDAGGERPA